MNRQLIRLSAVLTLLASVAGCASDATGALRGSVAGIELSRSYVELETGQSATITARAVDAQGNVLGSLPLVSSGNPAVASVAVDEVRSGHPAPQTVFQVTATGFGATMVYASSGTAVRTLPVVTFPSGIEIDGAPATLGSGTAVQLSPRLLDQNGKGTPALEGAEPIEWGSSDESVARVDPSGLVSARKLGYVTVTAGLRNGTSGDVLIQVVPGIFDGMLSADSAGFADVLILTPGTESWDGDEVVTVGGRDPWIESQDVSRIAFRVPHTGTPGPVDVLVDHQGPDDDIATATSLDVTSVFLPINDLQQAIDLTAGPFPIEFFISLPYAFEDFLADGVVLGSFQPATDLDVTVTAEWQRPNAEYSIYWDNCAGTGLGGIGFASAVTPPVVSSVTVPGGDCWIPLMGSWSGVETMVKVIATSP